MSDQQNESVATGRTEINDLPQPERELTADEAKNVQGGIGRISRDDTGNSLVAEKKIGSFGGDGGVEGKFGDGSV